MRSSRLAGDDLTQQGSGGNPHGYRGLRGSLVSFTFSRNRLDQSMSFPSAKKLEIWPLERLKPYARNARKHSAEQVEKISKSIATYGFNNPVLVDSEEGIIAGHGRMAAAKALGLTEVPVIVLDHLTQKQRQAYILADNRLAELGQWDEDLLASELGELNAEGFDIDALGWTQDEVDELTAELDELMEEEVASVADESGPETRKFSLEFEVADYVELSDKLDDLQKRWKLESHEEVFSHLVRGA